MYFANRVLNLKTELMTTREVAERIGVSEGCLVHWKRGRCGKGAVYDMPKPVIEMNKHTSLYARSDIEGWLSTKTFRKNRRGRQSVFID